MVDIVSSDNNYDMLFDHVSKLPLVILINTGRTGSDLFQSLLDSHPQILQLTGKSNIHMFLDQAVCLASSYDLAKEFAWHAKNITKFKSQYNVKERWNALGHNMDESFSVNIEEFSIIVSGILKNKKITRKNFIIAVHIAYGILLGQDIVRTKIIFIHTREIHKISEYSSDFERVHMLCSIREPKNSIARSVEQKSDDPPFVQRNPSAAWHYRFISWVFHDTEPYQHLVTSATVIPLERVHADVRGLMNNLCHYLGLEFQESLLECTYHGLRWWGDQKTPGLLMGVSPNNSQQILWTKSLSCLDAFVVDALLGQRMNQYGFEASHGGWRLIVAFPLLFFPTQYERAALRFTFRKKISAGQKAKQLIMEIVYCGLRVNLYLRYWVRSLTGQLYSSQVLGSLGGKYTT